MFLNFFYIISKISQIMLKIKTGWIKIKICRIKIKIGWTCFYFLFRTKSNKIEHTNILDTSFPMSARSYVAMVTLIYQGYNTQNVCWFTVDRTLEYWKCCSNGVCIFSFILYYICL